MGEGEELHALLGGGAPSPEMPPLDAWYELLMLDGDPVRRRRSAAVDRAELRHEIEAALTPLRTQVAALKAELARQRPGSVTVESRSAGSTPLVAPPPGPPGSRPSAWNPPAKDRPGGPSGPSAPSERPPR